MLDIPKRKYLIHKAVEFSALPKKTQELLGSVEDMAASFMYVEQPKLDGCNCIAVTDGADSCLYTRTGEVICSCNHLRAELLTLAPGVYLGELWKDGVDQPTISGWVRKKSEQRPELELHVFDYVPIKDFWEGYSNRSFGERHAFLIEQQNGPHRLGKGIYVVPYWTCKPGVQGRADAAPRRFHDGVIMRKRSAPWEEGPDKYGNLIKVKPTVTYDLLCVDTYPGKGKYEGKVGGLVLRWKDGEAIAVGGGLSDEQRNSAPEELVGRIWEVQALGVSTKGVLREPRLKGVRFDKEEADY